MTQSQCGPGSECYRYIMDSLILTGLLRESGPMSWKMLEHMACSHGIDLNGDFEKAIVSALKPGLIKARFEAATKEDYETVNHKKVGLEDEKLFSLSEDVTLQMLKERRESRKKNFDGPEGPEEEF